MFLFCLGRGHVVEEPVDSGGEFRVTLIDKDVTGGPPSHPFPNFTDKGVAVSAPARSHYYLCAEIGVPRL